MIVQRKAAILSIVGMLAIGALGVGCGSDDGGGEGDASESHRIAASLYSRDVPYYQAVAAGIEDQAQQYGWDLNLNFSKPDPSTQTDAINTLLGTRPDGLIMIPIDGEGLIPVAEDALDQDIPVVATGDDLAREDARSTYVGGDFEEYGRMKAQWIVDQLGGEGKVGIVHGIRGITFTEHQHDGALEVFGDNPGITVVDGPYAGNFTADLGLEAAQNLITANPDLDAIFFDNDDLALGGAQAARDRGIDPDDILIVGTDGLQAGLRGLKDGDLDYTLAQCAVDQGRESVRAVKALIDGEDVEPRIVTDVYEVTPDTLDDYLALEECQE